jgi:hypothetical protein
MNCVSWKLSQQLYNQFTSFTLPVWKSRDDSVGIALGCGLDDRVSGVRFPAEAENFSLHHRVQNGSGSHPTSYPMGTRGSFPGLKRPRREADHSPPYSAEVKNEWSYTSTPQYAFMAWCSVKAQGQLYLYLCLHFTSIFTESIWNNSQFFHCTPKTFIRFHSPEIKKLSTIMYCICISNAAYQQVYVTSLCTKRLRQEWIQI